MIKRFTALLIAVMLMLSMTAAVFAEEADNSAEQPMSMTADMGTVIFAENRFDVERSGCQGSYTADNVNREWYCFRFYANTQLITEGLTIDNPEIAPLTATNLSGVWQLQRKAAGTVTLSTTVDGIDYAFTVVFPEGSSTDNSRPEPDQPNQPVGYSGSYNFTYNNTAYTLVLGCVDSLDGPVLWGGSFGAQMTVDQIGKEDAVHNRIMAVTIFENVGTDQQAEAKPQIKALIKNVSFSTDDTTGFMTVGTNPNAANKNGNWYCDITMQPQINEAYVLAKVQLEIENASPITVTLGMKGHRTLRQESRIDCAERGIDTVDELNQLINNLTLSQNSLEVTEIYLAPVAYSGTVIVDGFTGGNRNLSLQGTADGEGNCTVIEGGIVLKKNISTISGIFFRAAEGVTTGILCDGGEASTANRCCFYGYDVAMDSNASGYIGAGNCVFVDNTVAVRVDCAEKTGGNANIYRNNTFIRNGKAMEIIGLPQYITPYDFRVTNSNFIGNDGDLDIENPGTFYMYKNYFGKIHPQAADVAIGSFLDKLHGVRSEQDIKDQKLLNSNGPSVKKANKTKVVTNPRWKYPVQNWWSLNVPIPTVFDSSATPAAETFTVIHDYINVLTSDWGETSTQILNHEAANLVLDPSAFDAEGEKTIDVVDQNETPLGKWQFD